MGFRLLAPSEPSEAFRLLADPRLAPVSVLAGGTDLLLDIDANRVAPATVLSLRHLPFRTIRWGPEELEVGSTAPLSELEEDPRLAQRLPGLAVAIGAVGGYALRHRATVGGNLARAAPASDLLPVLLAHDARVGLVGPEGERALPIEQFLIGSRTTALRPNELIRSAHVPYAPSTYLWQRVRPANDISQVGVAAARGPGGDWRIAVGGILPCARRLRTSERELRSPRPSAEEVRRAVAKGAEEAAFPTDKRASERYRQRLLGVLIERAVRLVAGAGET